MGTLQLTQIKSRLEEDLVRLVDLSDLSGHSQEEQRKAALSRALPAFVLQRRWGWTAADAVTAVTDGAHDGGLDLIAVDPVAPRLLLAQGKWSSQGTGSAAKVDMIKFAQGVARLLASDWDYFSDRIQARAQEIEAAILNPSVRIELVFAHSGSGALTEDVRTEIEPVLADLNEFDQVAHFAYLGQAEIHGLLIDDHQALINLDVDLSDWGSVDGLVVGYYGHVSGSDVASWYRSHGDLLFSSNLRSTLPDSTVNDGIVHTAKTAPERFWYFNNGITVLCQQVEKAPAGGTDRRLGHFRFSGAQVVNGAQTVGSLGQSFAHEDDPPDPDARVMIRFIQTEGAYDGFSNDVTRWTNTQNRVGGRDFLALDPEQTRIAREFTIDKLRYVFRSGEPDPVQSEGCGVQEATVALACLNSDIRLAVQAKREVSQLWADIEKAPYKTLFNATTTSQRVWRAVQVLRVAESELRLARGATSGKPKNFLTHLNRVVLWIVNQHLNIATRAELPDENWDAVLEDVKTVVPTTAYLLAHRAETTYEGYPANLAKNAGVCDELARSVLAALSKINAP